MKFKIVEESGTKNLTPRFEDAMNEFMKEVAEIHDIVFEYSLNQCRASITYTELEVDNYGSNKGDTDTHEGL